MTDDSFEPGGQSDSNWAICPYCGRATGDCWEWVQEMPQEESCDACGKTYRVWAEHSVEYRTEPVEP